MDFLIVYSYCDDIMFCFERDWGVIVWKEIKSMEELNKIIN